MGDYAVLPRKPIKQKYKRRKLRGIFIVRKKKNEKKIRCLLKAGNFDVMTEFEGKIMLTI